MKSVARNQASFQFLIPIFATMIIGLASTAVFAVPTYAFQTGTAAIVSGVTDTGSHCDDCVTNVALPFSFSLYGIGYTTVNVGANGNIQFTGNATFAGSDGLPDFHYTDTILALQTDLRTDQLGGGIYTSVSGAAPNRIFNIEWRAVLFSNPGLSVNFEVRLFEGTNRFEIIYGAIAVNGSSQTVGVEKDNTDFTQFAGNTAGTLFAGLALIAASPTAAGVSIGGQVLTANGNAIGKARVSLTASNGETLYALTNPFGYYRFENVAVGGTYVLAVVSKRYSIAPQAISVTGEMTELNFIAEP
ncbi:MAG: carboxypeptidase-like regulatory domain-containing protein [Pyrinomonadaceae bacterium]